MQADVHLLRCFESYETDTSAPHNLFLSPMQVSQARAERLILGGETFEMVTSEPGISEHKEGQFMLRASVKTGRRQETIRVTSNKAFNTGRYGSRGLESRGRPRKRWRRAARFRAHPRGSAARTPARLRVFLEFTIAPRALHVQKTRRVGLAPAHTPALRSAPRVQPRSTLPRISA